MQKLIELLRKLGILHVSKGDYYTGEFDDRSDLKVGDAPSAGDTPQKSKEKTEE